MIGRAAMTRSSTARSGDQHQEGADRTGDPIGVVLVVAVEHLAVDGHERGRQHPLAEEVLEEVGDSGRRSERIGGQRQPEHTRRDHLAEEAGDP